MTPAPKSRTVAIDSARLEEVIGVVAEASSRTKLTARQRRGYQVLMFSSDGMLVCLVVATLAGMLGFSGGVFEWVLIFPVMAYLLFSAVSVVTLALDLPLLWRTFREHRQLQALGVTSLTDTLWKAYRRHCWVDRIRSGVILLVSVLLILTTLPFFSARAQPDPDWRFAAFLLGTVGLLQAARYLRRRREQLDLAADADTLAQALQRLRDHAKKEQVIEVPVELLEHAAHIETKRISRERQRAILRSASERASAFAVSFDESARRLRAALSSSERVELDDWVSDLSAGGADPVGDRQPLMAGSHTYTAGGLHVAAVVDPQTRRIRIESLQPVDAAEAAHGH